MPMTEGKSGLEQGATELAAVRTLMRVPRLHPIPEEDPSPASGESGASATSVEQPTHGIDDPTWEPSNARGPGRRRTEILTYLSGVAGVFELWALGRAHLVEPRPLWLLAVVLAFAMGAGWVGDTVYRSHP